MTYVELRILHRELQTLLTRGPTHRKVGICGNVSVTIPDWYFTTWPEFSGNRMYPVPDPRSRARYPGVIFGSWMPKWTRLFAYGRSRRRLVKHLIQCVESDLATFDEGHTC